MQACRAYYKEGRIIPCGNVAIPEGSELIITILGESQEEKSHRQIEAMKRFREEIRNCNEPVPEFERVGFREFEI